MSLNTVFHQLNYLLVSVSEHFRYNSVRGRYVKNYMYIFCLDVQVQVASLAVFGAIINSDQTPVEIEELMLAEDFELAFSVLNSSSVVNSRLQQIYVDGHYPWIVELCNKHIFDENPLPIKIQSLQLLSNTTGKYFHKSK